MNLYDFAQTMTGNIEATNPEDLMLASEQAEQAGLIEQAEPASPELKAAALNLGKILLELNPVALASLVTKYAEEGGMPPSVANTMVQLLEHKIKDADPDMLNVLISEAKKVHVWPMVKASVLKRNEEIAEEVMQVASLEELQESLPVIATSENWLPGPVYQAASHVLCQLASQAASVDVLDEIVEFAKGWRLLRSVMPVVKQRNSWLVAQIAEYKRPTGYIMQRGSKKILVEHPLRALRMQDQGYEFIKQ